MDIADVPVAVLAGGLATRLRPITATIPKILVEVAGRPFVDHQLALLQRHGFRRVVLCLGYLGEQVEAHVGDGAAYGLHVQYSHDGPTLLGTGGALRRAAVSLGEICCVTYGDSYLDIPYAEVLRSFVSGPGLGMMTVLHNADRWDRSNVVYRDGRLLCYDKRVQTSDMTHIDYGVAFLRAEAVGRIPAGEPADLADLYHDLVAEGRMDGFEVAERFYEIGSFSGLAEAHVRLAREVR